jgi:hypothetical protein
MRIVGTPLSLARVAELADAYGSGPYGATRGGSSPLASRLVNRRARSVDLGVGRHDVRANGSDRRHAALRPCLRVDPEGIGEERNEAQRKDDRRHRPPVSSSGDVA